MKLEFKLFCLIFKIHSHAHTNIHKYTNRHTHIHTSMSNSWLLFNDSKQNLIFMVWKTLNCDRLNCQVKCAKNSNLENKIVKFLPICNQMLILFAK